MVTRPDYSALPSLDLIHQFEDLIKAFTTDTSVDGDLRRYYETKRELMSRMGIKL